MQKAIDWHSARKNYSEKSMHSEKLKPMGFVILKHLPIHLQKLSYSETAMQKGLLRWMGFGRHLAIESAKRLQKGLYLLNYLHLATEMPMVIVKPRTSQQMGMHFLTDWWKHSGTVNYLVTLKPMYYLMDLHFVRQMHLLN